MAVFDSLHLGEKAAQVQPVEAGIRAETGVLSRAPGVEQEVPEPGVSGSTGDRRKVIPSIVTMGRKKAFLFDTLRYLPTLLNSSYFHSRNPVLVLVRHFFFMLSCWYCFDLRCSGSTI